jgi:protoporphyrinogen oxidase
MISPSPRVQKYHIVKMDKLKTIGVIGGGIMGIDIARRLSREGYKVSIIESSPDLGGLVSISRFGDYTWDKFYHVILPDDTYTLNMIKELGLENDLKWNKTKTGFFTNGSYFSMSDIIEFLKFPTLNLIDKFRLAVTILIGSYVGNYERLETIPVTVWLKRWSGKNTYNRIWLPLLKAKLGEGYKLTSAAFICATIKRLYGARKKGAKKEIFGYVNGGYAHILETIKEKIISENIKLVTNFKVAEINQRPDQNLKVISSEGREMNFNYVISTLPSALTAKVCPELSDFELEKLKKTKYLGVVCLSLLLKKPLTPYYITNITDDKIKFTGVIEITSLVGTSFFGGNSLVYLPKYVSSDDQLFDLTDQRLKDSFISSLKLMQPLIEDEEIIDCQVAKARFVFTLPEMGYSKDLPSFRTSVKNLFVINSSFITDGTLNVNETLEVSASYLHKVLNIIGNEE